MMRLMFTVLLSDSFIDVNAVIVKHIQQQLLTIKQKDCTLEKFTWNIINKYPTRISNIRASGKMIVNYRIIKQEDN